VDGGEEEWIKTRKSGWRRGKIYEGEEEFMKERKK
jgi:hypothetical protein